MQNVKIDTKRESILVIQSDPAEPKILSSTFGGRYTLFSAGGVDHALRICRNFPCKVAVFDAGCAQPHDLLELERFKAGNRLETPIIVIASENSAAIEMKVAEIGVFYHLIRPYPVKDLEDLIEAALRYWQRIFGWKRAGVTG